MLAGAMWQLIGTVASAFGLVFLAELGDKTQLLAVGFGARYPMRTVMIGLTLGFAAAGAVAALVGGVLGAALPEQPIAIAGGLLFLVFALVTVVGAVRDDKADDDEVDHVVHVRNVIASIALTIAIGELGDKTQLATATLAAQANPVAVWVGATAGEVLAASIGAFFGSRVGARLNPKAVKLASAALFALFGVLLLVSA
jgi:putative Ca2+/H+ antiporter (TMEM165/GDT1 family)